MTSKLIPSNPSEVMVIRQITKNITILSLPFSRFGHFHIGGRGTLVKLSSGGVAVFSPVALTPEVKETVSKMGELRYIAALDIEHHIFLGAWNKEYPNALILGPEGLLEKRAKQKDEAVPINIIFTAKEKETTKVSAEFDADFEYEYVDAHVNKEIVFNYKPDRTLIEADLLFNLPATEQYSKTPVDTNKGFLTRLFAALQGTGGKALAQQRMIWYGTSAGDRRGFAKSMQVIRAWDFDRLVPCHGDVIETGAKGIFEKIMAWHLGKTGGTGV
ncbi:hypothetical protein EG327_009867 [Venturia inaequalis]|uniref:Nuclear protein Qri2/Nse4 n=1 Tax=Venturia inaequalis TaxID=5025 RepID=A0A8H3ULL5_VENIN|nr:hypothetical protein EG327_009867 [Venturia inaequalis]